MCKSAIVRNRQLKRQYFGTAGGQGRRREIRERVVRIGNRYLRATGLRPRKGQRITDIRVGAQAHQLYRRSFDGRLIGAGITHRRLIDHGWRRTVVTSTTATGSQHQAMQRDQQCPTGLTLATNSGHYRAGPCWSMA